MRATHEVGVSYKAVGVLVDRAFHLSAKSHARHIDACALLLAAAEYSVLVANDGWCFHEDKTAMLASMRDKAKETAWYLYTESRSQRV